RLCAGWRERMGLGAVFEPHRQRWTVLTIEMKQWEARMHPFRRKSWWLTGLRAGATMACGSALFGASGSPATARPEAAAATADPAATAVAQDWHVPYAEAARRIGRQDRIDRLAAQLAAAHADTLAGVWIDHANGGRVVVA